jgi:hypothetical protein
MVQIASNPAVVSVSASSWTISRPWAPRLDSRPQGKRHCRLLRAIRRLLVLHIYRRAFSSELHVLKFPHGRRAAT